MNGHTLPDCIQMDSLENMISVIIPVYNVEKYLQRCVDSILNQTYRDLELVLVDDGSLDNSGLMCDAYAAQDPRVRVIHKENGGVSSARNAGLDAAKGDYITFVDSDDYIDACMYEKMMAKAEMHNCDVVMCDCVKEFGDRSVVYSHEIRAGFYDAVQLRKEYYPHLLMMENVEYPATISNCIILWKSSMNTPDMRYAPGIRFSEDLLFGAKLLRRASSFCYMKNEPFYHYVMNPYSATHKFAPDKWKDYGRLHTKIREFFGNDAEFDFSHQIDLCLLFFVYNAVGDIMGTEQLDRKQKAEKVRGILGDKEVKKLFSHMRVQELQVSKKQKLITWLYKWNLGIGFLCWYFEKK